MSNFLQKQLLILGVERVQACTR